MAMVTATDRSFAIDDSGALAQALQRLDDQREAAREVIARRAVESDPRASLTRNNPKAVVLNLMQPLAA